jgi:hypothetical protein
MGAKKLRKIQMGIESTAGTAVAATEIWRGKGVMMLDDEKQLIDEEIAIHFPSDRSATPKLAASVKLDAIAATPEQLPVILSSAIKDVVTGSADGTASSGYTYAYVFDSAYAANTIKYRTIEGITAQQTKEMEYAFVEEFTISGDAAGLVTMECLWRGRQWTNVTKTALTTLVDVDELLFGGNALTIDNGGGTIGTTSVSGLLSFKLTVKTGWIPVFEFDNVYFTDVDYVGATGTLDLTIKHNADAITEETAWDAETTRLVRMDLLSAAYGTAGSGTLFTGGKKGVRIDCAGKYVPSPQLEEQDGNDTEKYTLELSHNTTDDLFLAITCANELTAIAG